MTIKSPEKPAIKYPHIRQMVETFYAIQNLRIQAGNRLGAYDRMGIPPERSKEMHSWVDERLSLLELELGRKITSEVKTFPIFNTWLLKVKGIGPVLSGCLLAWIVDIGRFANISKLWRYCGMAVIDGKSERPTKGEKLHYSPVMKLTCWKIGESFVKSGGYYREIYDQYKARIKALHPEPVNSGRKSRDGKPIMAFTPGHIHSMAKRKAVKQFLADMWIAWRKLEGLTVTMPYAIEKLGHTTYQEPEI